MTNELPDRPQAPWTSHREAQAASLLREENFQAAVAGGSLVVDNDEGFYDVIQQVDVEAWTYEDVYWVWPRVTNEIWEANHLPCFKEDDRNFPHYGRLLRFVSGPWQTHAGIYLRLYPNDGALHQVLVAGPPSGGQLKVVLTQEHHFLVKSVRSCGAFGRDHRYISIDSDLLGGNPQGHPRVRQAMEDLAQAMAVASLTTISVDMQNSVATRIQEVSARSLASWGSTRYDPHTGEVITPTTYTLDEEDDVRDQGLCVSCNEPGPLGCRCDCNSESGFFA